MKLKILLYGLLFLSYPVLSQDFQSFSFGFGGNAAYAPLTGLNRVIQHYQDMRFVRFISDSPEDEYAINNISGINVLLGPSLSFGYSFKPQFNFEFKYLDRKHPGGITSQVRDINNNTIKRSIDFKSRTFGFGLSHLVVTGKNEYIIGGTMNFTQIAVDVTNVIKPQPVNTSQIGSTLFLKYIFNFSETSPFAIVIMPYFQYHFTDGDFSELNRILNPKTAGRLSAADVSGSRSYYGLELQLNYFVFTGFNKENIEK